MRIKLMLLLAVFSAYQACAQDYVPMPDYSAVNAYMAQGFTQLQNILNEAIDSGDKLHWAVTPNHDYIVSKNPLQLTLHVYLYRAAPWYEISGTIENDTYRDPLKWDGRGGFELPDNWTLHYGDLVIINYSGGHQRYGAGTYRFTVGVDDNMTRESWRAMCTPAGLRAKLAADERKLNASHALPMPTSASPYGMQYYPTPTNQAAAPTTYTRSRAEISYDIQNIQQKLSEAQRNMRSLTGSHLAESYGYAGIIADYQKMLNQYQQEYARANH